MKILIIAPLSADCDISICATRYPTAAEWDAVEAYVAICRRAADRAVVKDYLTTDPLLRAYEAVGKLNRLMDAIHGDAA